MTGARQIDTDILVIGSGPGGAVSATLFAQAGHDVLMVEEGEHLPLSSAPHFSREEMLQKYRNAGVNVALGRQKLAWVEGRCVGGGSEINRGLYHRTPDYILDAWRRDFGVADLDLTQLKPHFEACEAVARVEYVPGAQPAMSQLLQRGADAQGWHAIEAPRLFHYSKGRQGGEKQSMSATFVERFHQAGGRLLASTRIARLRRVGGQWQAEGRQRSGDGTDDAIHIRARKVFVACGAVHTPALLRRSGIRRNIGNSLRFHPMLKVVAEFDHEVNRSDDVDPVHQVKEFEPRFGMGCSISKRPMLGMALAGRAGHWPLVEEKWKHMGIYYVQSTGGAATVRNLPGLSSPLVRVGFTPLDLVTLNEGLTRLCQALFAAGAVRVYPCIDGYPVLNNASDLARLPQRLAGADGSLTSVHIFSSCPMGGDARHSATDSFGKVHGVDGLYISDASLLCTPTAVNPQGTVMAIAHRNATQALSRRFG